MGGKRKRKAQTRGEAERAEQLGRLQAVEPVSDDRALAAPADAAKEEDGWQLGCGDAGLGGVD